MKSLLREHFSKMSSQVFYFSLAAILLSMLIVTVCFRWSFGETIGKLDKIQAEKANENITAVLGDYFNENSEIGIQPSIDESQELEKIASAYGVSTILIIKDTGGEYRYQYTFDDSHPEDTYRYGELVEPDILKGILKASPSTKMCSIDTVYGQRRCFVYKPSNSAYVNIAFSDEVYAEGRKTITIILCIIMIFIIMLLAKMSSVIFGSVLNPTKGEMTKLDELTGLNTKNAFELDVKNLERSSKKDEYAVIVADLNGLKTINDTLGHPAGDKFLQNAAMVLKEAVTDRKRQYTYRTGGDEFIVLIKNATLTEIEEFMSRVETGCDRVNKMGGMKLAFALGYAFYDRSSDKNITMTIRRADMMMYENKRLYYERTGKARRVQ